MEINSSNVRDLGTEVVENKRLGYKGAKLYLIDNTATSGYDITNKAGKAFQRILPKDLQELDTDRWHDPNVTFEEDLLKRNIVILQRATEPFNFEGLPEELKRDVIDFVILSEDDGVLFQISRSFLASVRATVWQRRMKNLLDALKPDRFYMLKSVSETGDTSNKEVVKAMFKQLWTETKAANNGKLPSNDKPFSITKIREFDESIKREHGRNFLIFISKLSGGEDFLNEAEIKDLPQAEKVAKAKKWFKTNIDSFTQMTQLNFSNPKLTWLPPEIGQLTALQELDLAFNKLSNLPPEIGQLTALQHLNLASNKLSNLPPEIGQLTALQNLYLIKNKLSNLPPEFAQLTALRDLCLSRNEFLDLPPEVIQILSKRPGIPLDLDNIPIHYRDFNLLQRSLASLSYILPQFKKFLY